MNTTRARETPHTPATGSAERNAILDAARTPAEKALDKTVVFRVSRLSVMKGWAYLEASVQCPGRQSADHADTPLRQAAGDDGDKSDVCMALLRHRDDAWQVQEYCIGLADVSWVAWPEQHDAPRAIFPFPKAPPAD